MTALHHASSRLQNRRSIRRLLAAALLTALPLTATAQPPQKYPVKPIRLICAFTPGGTTDILARIITPGMSEAWGQPIALEARPGAGGTRSEEHTSELQSH